MGLLVGGWRAGYDHFHFGVVYWDKLSPGVLGTMIGWIIGMLLWPSGHSADDEQARPSDAVLMRGPSSSEDSPAPSPSR
jgi:hypothetical protein